MNAQKSSLQDELEKLREVVERLEAKRSTQAVPPRPKLTLIRGGKADDDAE